MRALSATTIPTVRVVTFSHVYIFTLKAATRSTRKQQKQTHAYGRRLRGLYRRGGPNFQGFTIQQTEI